MSTGLLYCDEHLTFIDIRDDSLVDNRNTASWTGLMYASHIGHTRIASLLVECGCDVNKHNGRGQNAMMLAASCGNESVGRVLALVGVYWISLCSLWVLRGCSGVVIVGRVSVFSSLSTCCDGRC